MSLSLWLLLIPFGLLFVVWLIFSLVALTKMLRFGFLSRPAVISSFGYIFFAVIVVVATAVNLASVDWSATLEIGSSDISLPSLPSVTNTFQQ